VQSPPPPTLLLLLLYARDEQLICSGVVSVVKAGPFTNPGLYLSNFIRGVEVLAIEVDDRANA